MSYKLLSYLSGRDPRAGVLIDDVVYDAAKLSGCWRPCSIPVPSSAPAPTTTTTCRRWRGRATSRRSEIRTRSGSSPGTPASEIRDPQKIALKLWVNDELMQDSDTSLMIFTTAEQIAHISARVTLHPGDLVLTGTPAGVGMGRGRFLKAGDVVKLWIEGSNTMTA